jgi:hypothetical protein
VGTVGRPRTAREELHLAADTPLRTALRLSFVAGVAALITLAAAGVGPSSAGVPRPAAEAIPVAAAAADAPERPEQVSIPTPLAVADPVRIVIPAIEVDASIVPVGLLPDGAMEVPDFGVAGDYVEGPRPGEPGPAVIAAHVDSLDGPDVFFRLSEVEPGDEIHIHTADGEIVTFVAGDKEMTPKDELPVDRIWDGSPEPVLRLITCGGEFDRGTRHYTHNWTVYAEQA